MIFHELYGSYYEAVQHILALAVKGNLTEKEMESIARTTAFSESALTIVPSLKNQQWKLLTKDLHTPLKHIPSFPLTDLELRWLKAISLDKRIQLFQVDTSFLDGIEPLFQGEDIRIFDQYLDGDNYDNPEYIRIFQILLNAIHAHGGVEIEYFSNKGNKRRICCLPYEMEYSKKDDKFRVRVSGCRFANIFNVGNIQNCRVIGTFSDKTIYHQAHSDQYLCFLVKNERNALERVLLHFAHFQKSAKRLENNTYEIQIHYDKADETELLIRILSFGPLLKITEPASFIELVRERLEKQMVLGIK